MTCVINDRCLLLMTGVLHVLIMTGVLLMTGIQHVLIMTGVINDRHVVTDRCYY